jgi:hypothetical protein
LTASRCDILIIMSRASVCLTVSSVLLSAAILNGCDSSDSPPPPATEQHATPPEASRQSTPANQPTDDPVARLLARLDSDDPRDRADACRAIATHGENAAEAVRALGPVAASDPDDQVRFAAVQALRSIGTITAGDALAEVIRDGDPADPAWKDATYAAVEALPPREVAKVFARRAASTPAARVLLCDAARTAEPTDDIKRFLLGVVNGDDVRAAESAGLALLSFNDRAAETFDEVVRSIMPRLPAHGRKLRFAREVAATQTMQGAKALADFGAGSDELDDWRVVVEVFQEEILPEHQECFEQFRGIAVKNRGWRFQIEVRKLLREKYPHDLTLTIRDRTFTYDAVWTREDLLEWEKVQRKARDDTAVIWPSSMETQLEIAVVETPKDYLLLDSARRIRKILERHLTRGARTPDGIMYIIVLDGGTVAEIGAQVGDVVEFDDELVHALSEMELQDQPPGRDIGGRGTGSG